MITDEALDLRISRSALNNQRNQEILRNSYPLIHYVNLIRVKFLSYSPPFNTTDTFIFTSLDSIVLSSPNP